MDRKIKYNVFKIEDCIDDKERVIKSLTKWDNNIKIIRENLDFKEFTCTCFIVHSLDVYDDDICVGHMLMYHFNLSPIYGGYNE